MAAQEKVRIVVPSEQQKTAADMKRNNEDLTRGAGSSFVILWSLQSKTERQNSQGVSLYIPGSHCFRYIKKKHTGHLNQHIEMVGKFKFWEYFCPFI